MIVCLLDISNHLWIPLLSPESGSRVFAHVSCEIRDQVSLGDGLEVGKFSLKVTLYAQQNPIHFRGTRGLRCVLLLLVTDPWSLKFSLSLTFLLCVDSDFLHHKELREP